MNESTLVMPPDSATGVASTPTGVVTTVRSLVLLGTQPTSVVNGATWATLPGTAALSGFVLNSSNTVGDGGVWPFPLDGGTWSLIIQGLATTNGGVVTVDLSKDGVNWSTIATQDCYAASTTGITYGTPLNTYVSVPYGYAATTAVRFRALSHNASSSGYVIALGGVSAIRVSN